MGRKANPRKKRQRAHRSGAATSTSSHDNAAASASPAVAGLSEDQAVASGGSKQKAEQDPTPSRSNRACHNPTSTTQNDESSAVDQEKDSGEDDRDDRSERSMSAGGYDYDWATECLILKKEDIIKNMSMQASYKAQIEIKGKIKFVQFNRGDLIYTLPDPRDLEKNEDGNTSTTRTELSTEDINLGILRVRWLYNQKQASELNQGRAVLHGQYVNQVEKMQFEKHERVYTDHYDFIGLETFSGFADEIQAYLEIHGLEVADVERVGPVKKRNPVTPKKWVWMTGFNDRKKRKLIDMGVRVQRDRKGKLTFEANRNKGKGKNNDGSSTSATKKRDASSEAGPNKRSAKKAK